MGKNELSEVVGEVHKANFLGQLYDVITLDGADQFRWKYYKYVEKILKESRLSVIVVSSSIDRIPPSIRRKCVTIKVEPPCIEDVKQFVNIKFPDFKGNIEEIWNLSNNNMNVFINNIMYNNISNIVVEKEYTLKELTTLILSEPNRRFVFKALHSCDKPWWWIIGWLRENIPLFYSKEDVIYYFDLLAWIDKNKFKTARMAEYIFSILAFGIDPVHPRLRKKLWVRFPDIIKKPPKKSVETVKKERVVHLPKKYTKSKKEMKQTKINDIFSKFGL